MFVGLWLFSACDLWGRTTGKNHVRKLWFNISETFAELFCPSHRPT